MPKIRVHFLASPLCHKLRHIPTTPQQLLWPRHQLASCLLKPRSHIQALPAVSSWQHLTLHIILCSFFLAPWQPAPLVIFAFLITPGPLLWELLPCHLPLLNWCPGGGWGVGASQASFPSHVICRGISLSLLCLQIPADDCQIVFSSPDVAPEFPGIYPQAYWNPHWYKPQACKFHYVHNRAHCLPPHLFPSYLSVGPFNNPVV